MMKTKRLTPFLLTCCGAPTLLSGQVSDDFNDGDDVGWTRTNPLAALGGGSTYSFPNGERYRIQADPSPNAGAFGRSRLGSLKDDLSLTAFRVAVDLIDIDLSSRQDIGILARVTTPGLQTLSGYAATIDVGANGIFLSKIAGEVPSNLGSGDLTLDPNKDYRLVFHGYGERLLIEVFDAADLGTVLTTVEGVDSTYATGQVGLFGSATNDTAGVDVIFDDFEADANPDVDRDGMFDPVEAGFFGNLDQSGGGDFDGDGRSNAEELEQGTNPTVKDSGIQVTQVSLSAADLTVEFAVLDGKSYQLEISNDLRNWVVDGDAVYRDLGNGLADLTTSRTGGAKYARVICRRSIEPF